MSFSDLLLSIGDFVLGTWDAILYGLVGLWRIIDYVLQPVMSPLLSVLNPICTKIGDAAYAILNVFPVWTGLVIISIVVGVLMLIAFRYLSNQTAIGRAKDDIKANLLAMKLYKDELRVVFTSQLRLLWAIARLQRFVLTPVLILLLPMLLGLAQMGVRYQWRPVHVGEQVQVTAQVTEGTSNLVPDISLEAPPALLIEAGPVPGGGLVAWRIRAVEPGRHTLRLTENGAIIDKELVVDSGFARVSPLRPAHRWTDQLLYPCEPPLPTDSSVKGILVDYPLTDSVFHGSNYWILTFFIISMAVTLILKPAFRVRF
jgi:hypothetical protein